MMPSYWVALGTGERHPSPGCVVDGAVLEKHVRGLDCIQKRTGAKIMLAVKGFGMWSVFPLLSRRGSGALHGVCASSPDEARLGREEFGGEVHAFAAAWSDEDMREVLPYVDHMLFNSFAQWRHFRPVVESCTHTVSCGLRINPEHSEGAVPIYDPCSPGSRLGIRADAFEGESLEGIQGLHFHTLCEQGADALERTLAVVEERFAPYLSSMQWLNFGGGHHITRAGYDIDLLCRLVARVQQKYDVQVYLEPGEAVALNAGWLVCTVLDIVEADMPVAILDTSASAHMPDVLEMPYRPEIIGAGVKDQKAYSYRLAGKSCLAGDVIGEYSFDFPLTVGTRLVFADMAHYSMVKTTTFNGLRLPSIAIYRPEKDLFRLVRSFSYEDFKMRLS